LPEGRQEVAGSPLPQETPSDYEQGRTAPTLAGLGTITKGGIGIRPKKGLTYRRLGTILVSQAVPAVIQLGIRAKKA